MNRLLIKAQRTPKIHHSRLVGFTAPAGPALGISFVQSIRVIEIKYQFRAISFQCIFQTPGFTHVAFFHVFRASRPG